MNRRLFVLLFPAILLMMQSSCAPAVPDSPEESVSIYTPAVFPTDTAAAPPTETAQAVPPATRTKAAVPVTGSTMKPADVPPPADHIVHDVRSAGRKRAPYGDSYDINRIERPFQQDMKYIPELDIVSFNVSEDADWYYVSILLSGDNPNHKLGIHYGVELDLDADGFGDLLIWASPPYRKEWRTKGLQVYRDTDHDTAGLSGARSDSGFTGNGYETLIFDGASGKGDDPGLAWVRMQKGSEATMQLAFKKALSGPVFLIGVLADGGLKDVSMLDYNDRFKASEAGSPIRGDFYYPLKMLFAVDNTCWQAYGMKNPSTVAKVCPPSFSQPVTVKRSVEDGSTAPVPTAAVPTQPPVTETSYP